MGRPSGGQAGSRGGVGHCERLRLVDSAGRAVARGGRQIETGADLRGSGDNILAEQAMSDLKLRALAEELVLGACGDRVVSG